ncbi:MAG: phosphoribosyl-AMP cyclohydrolase [Euryarchaeota archaeon]|jgi:hypothetical protein|nr:phosphoribosyl-AMP cyclohydrolase [Euryarchaeota archaeon]MBT7987935.1 phosphoribosyl-AMP cyclohydrolase [Euryarchaeota archaeon]
MVSLVEVKEAQRAWGEGIVAIATAHTNGGDYIGLATDHVNTLYAYQMGPVLFKPTLAATDQFRPTFQTALSYFVASNNACPEDQGFAIRGWTNVRFENSDVIIDGNTALAMGNYFFTSQEGLEIKVEYTFGYIADENGGLRIQLHHSSMPAESN